MTHDETCTEDRVLADRELDAVTGGLRRFSTLVSMEVEGHIEAKWTPRSYAVQTDLPGGITGAQASLYEWRRP
jgi:hypothetical protein